MTKHKEYSWVTRPASEEGGIVKTITDKKSLKTQQTQERVPAVPTPAQMATAVMREMQAAGQPCTPAEAATFVGWLDQVLTTVRQRRGRKPGQYFLTEAEIDSVHRVLDIVIPDDKAPADGSAHALLNRGLLRDGEVSISHSKARRFHQVYCTVTVDVLAID
jgi:hypothetical protein